MRGRTLTVALAATIGIAAGCGKSSDAGGAADAGTDRGAETGHDGAAACVPTLPALPWTSPYAGWSRGVPTDPGSGQ